MLPRAICPDDCWPENMFTMRSHKLLPGMSVYDGLSQSSNGVLLAATQYDELDVGIEEAELSPSVRRARRVLRTRYMACSLHLKRTNFPVDNRVELRRYFRPDGQTTKRTYYGQRKRRRYVDFDYFHAARCVDRFASQQEFQIHNSSPPCLESLISERFFLKRTQLWSQPEYS